MAPVAVVDPRIFLTILAAIFRSPTSSALGKLPGEFFPSPTGIIGTLPDSPLGIVFAAKVSHHHTSPILHIFGVMANRELLHQGERVEVVWL
jgi:hypothetical protein